MPDRQGERKSTDGPERAANGAEATDGPLDRRTVLKGTAVAGLAGAGLSSPASASGRNEISFCAAGDDVFRYHFVASGRVERGGKFESDEDDQVGHDFASGAVAEERCDSFLFTGDLEKLRLNGPGTVLINGKVVEDTTKPDLPNTITIEAGRGVSRYKFRVSGRVEPGPDADPGDDVIDGNVVRGAVADGGSDDFRYSGAIAFDRATGPVTVTLDINP